MTGQFQRRRTAAEEESYFVSMSDMLVGLLFIFIILLVYFAITFKETTAQLSGASEARAQLLRNLKLLIEAESPEIDVIIDTEAGLMRLPENLLFESGSAELKDEAYSRVAIIANALAQELPCYTDRATDSAPSCSRTREAFSVDTLLIEGHTDADQFRGDANERLNLDLSANRATNTYLAMTNSMPGLRDLTNGDIVAPQPVLGVAGYGPFRPARNSRGVPIPATQKEVHRRIDLRFIMMTPRTEQRAKVEEMLEQK